MEEARGEARRAPSANRLSPPTVSDAVPPGTSQSLVQEPSLRWPTPRLPRTPEDQVAACASLPMGRSMVGPDSRRSVVTDRFTATLIPVAMNKAPPIAMAMEYDAANPRHSALTPVVTSP